jgi:hypothetical protein
LWAEWPRDEVLEQVPHRHVVVTIPRFLRRAFLKRRNLMHDLSQSASEALSDHVWRAIGEGARPGVVVSIATSGDLLQ